MKKLLVLFSFLALVPLLTRAQDWSGNFFKGYRSSLSAGKFSYHSPQPDVTNSLLLRSIDSTAFIEWETEPVPAGFKGPFASFVWMFGIDANPECHTYKLYVNGNYCLTFANPPVSTLKPWMINGREGSKLSFRTTMLDKYDDPMGYAVLDIPLILLNPGQPQVIRVVGESAGSNVWYMTFEAPVEEGLEIQQEEALLDNGGKPAFSVLFNFIHLGDPVNGHLEIPGIIRNSFRLEPGFNQVQVLVPEERKAGNFTATIRIKGLPPYSREFSVHEVRHWMIYLVQHAHTDIGYTRPQTEILPEHLRYIDYALDYCDQTDTFPDDARFRWTCETSWAVKEYLLTRPASQLERLKRRIHEGRIEVTGLFLNSSDLSDETSVAGSLQPVKMFRNAGIPVNAAMQDDINGVPWCLVDYLDGCGIRYLSMGQNDTRALKPFDRPTTFWWESPSGNRIMVNRPEHYMWGNQLGILTNAATFGRSLFIHLRNISGKGYPYDHYSIQFSGYLTDNSPPSTTACRIVKEWNEKYIWPRLRLATISEFGNYMKETHSPELPVYRGAWPDWWMDGFGSAFLETSYARMAHEDYIANQGLMAMAALLGTPLPGSLIREQQEAGESGLFYDEHTFGAAESISDPLNENTIVQWGEKSAYAWDAVKKNRIIREEVLGILQPFIPRSGKPVITLFNTLNWPRSGIATVYIDHQVIPGNKAFHIADEQGKTIPVQLVSRREEGSYWALDAERVPPLGYRSYRVYVDDNVIDPGKKERFNGSLENDRYRVSFDTVKGSVSSLYDKRLNKELVDPSSPWQFGRFIYETLGKNRSQLEQLKLGEFKRTTLSKVHFGVITSGPVWKSITLTGTIGGCAGRDGVSCEIRLYNSGDQKIELLFSMKKLAVPDPEAVYVAFPFGLNHAHLVCEMQGGTMVPGKEQIPGSSSDWQGIQNFVSVRGDSAQVVFVSPEAPLVQLGDLNLGKFAYTWKPASNAIFSWVLNNYWTTNFRAYQEGEFKWTYRIITSADTTNGLATRFGWGERIPFISRVFPGRNDSVPMKPPRYPLLQSITSFIGNAAEDLLLVSARPSAENNGVVLQFREINGIPASLPLDLPLYSSLSDLKSVTYYKTATEVNVLERTIRTLGGTLEFRPGETRFIKLELGP